MGYPAKAFVEVSAYVCTPPEMRVEDDSLHHIDTGVTYAPVIVFMNMETGELVGDTVIEVVDYQTSSIVPT